MDVLFIWSAPKTRIQPTAFDAQDRCSFEGILCCAPSSAADAQAVRNHGASRDRANKILSAISARSAV